MFSDQGLCLLRAELSSLQTTSPCVAMVTVTFREVQYCFVAFTEAFKVFFVLAALS